MKRVCSFWFVLLCAAIIFLPGCYVFKQGVYLLHYQRQAEDIDELLEEDGLSEQEKEMLLLVREIKSFAVNTLGLDEDKNYTRYVSVEKEYLVDVVSAADKDAFEAYTWEYPIVGEVPYKGFYQREDALRLVKRLKRGGYDVMMRQVDAFSTLGYFSDPVFSFMQDYSEYSLADLVIHEQTHATLFIKDEIQFNEELAMFMGLEGALLFLDEEYGDSGGIRKEIELFHREQQTFFSLIDGLYQTLDEIYSSAVSREEKLIKKEEAISSFKEHIISRYDGYFSTPRYKRVFQGEINNAYILSLRTYTRDLSLFYQVLEMFGGDLPEAFKEIRKVEDYPGDPKEFLAELLG